VKWLRTIVVFDKGGIVRDSEWAAVHESYVRSIQKLDHPEGSGALTLRKKFKVGRDWKRNGVGYLRKRFFAHLVNVEKWRPEGEVELHPNRERAALSLYPSGESYSEPITSKFGGFDFTTMTKSGRFAIEWETGNISSSHRSMNKLAIALRSGIIQAGVLIVPSKATYEHLTDRIGNIGELSGYLEMWEHLKEGVERGLLAVTVVEHDALSTDEKIPFLRTGSDGNAKKVVREGDEPGRD
jgi:Restriction endonuclease BamHI